MYGSIKTLSSSVEGYKHLLFPVLSIIALSLALPFVSGLWPIVRFTRERIEVYVRPGSITVIGYYVYRNPYPFPVVQGLSVPFPVDENHPVPEMISAERLSLDGTDVGAGRTARIDLAEMDALKTGDINLNAHRGEVIPLRHFLGVHRFELRFLPNEEAVVRILYTQTANVKNGTYILTTTRPWRAPLEEGIYRIYSSGVKIATSKYELAECRNGVLGFHKTGFMPEADWSFSWD